MNNINKLKNFFLEKTNNCLLVNSINQEIDILYIFFIKHFANKSNYLINFIDRNSKKEDVIDFFNQNKIDIYNITSSKHIDELLLNNSFKIIFTDYKNFKRLSKNHLNINSYQYRLDINVFLEQEFKIKNKNLLEIIHENPFLIYSELGKFKINQDLPSDLLNIKINNEENSFHRLDYYKLKNSQEIDLINLYKLIKGEVYKKKLSFLTY